MSTTKHTKRKATDALAVALIDDIEQRVAKLRKLAPNALKSSDFIEFGNKIQTHVKRLERREAAVDLLSKKKQQDTRAAEKECELKRIIAQLLPPDMQHIEVKSASVFDDADNVVHELRHGVDSYPLANCAFSDGDCIEPHRCSVEIASEDGVVGLLFVCALGDKPEIEAFRMHINIGNFDRFERDFSNQVRNVRSKYRKALGTRPVWAYVLLSMFVYGEHVFAPLTQKDAQRVQHDIDKRHVHDVLDRFWTFGRSKHDLDSEIAPFLVRLMPPAFALKLDLERDAKLFY